MLVLSSSDTAKTRRHIVCLCFQALETAGYVKNVIVSFQYQRLRLLAECTGVFDVLHDVLLRLFADRNETCCCATDDTTRREGDEPSEPAG